MDTRPPKIATVAVLVVFALSCFGVALFIWRTFGGTTPLQAQGYRVHVRFGPEATQLTQGAQVRIAGIRVGRVVRTATRAGRIDATLELESRYAPMPADTRAIIRYKTLLGESFVALTPGTRTGPKVADGGTLGQANVLPKQTIDQVLSAFDRPTRERLQRFLTGLHDALRGRGEDLSAVLGNAAPASEDLARLSESLDAQEPALRELVRSSAQALDAIGQRSTDAQRLVRAADAVFTTTGSRDRALTAGVRRLPPFLRTLRATLAEVDGAARDAAPSLHTLRPAAKLVRPALDATSQLAPELQRTFTRLQPVVRHSGKTLPALQKVLDAAGPLMTQLAPAGRQLVPVLQLLEAYRTEAVGSLANAGSATSEIIGGHHGLRILLTLNSQAPFGQETPQGSWRVNPYPAPGQLFNLAQGKAAFTCRDASRPTTIPVGGAPPCLAQKPWTFQGATRSYPHVQPNRP